MSIVMESMRWFQIQPRIKYILVQAPNGAWFLPGGEIEAGEDHFLALERELIEELGFTATIGEYYGQADEYFYSRSPRHPLL